MLIWQLITVQVVAFIFIVLFLRWLLHAHIVNALRRLRKLNQENLEKEKALKEELERARKEARREVEEGRRQAEELKEQAKKEAEKNREDVLIRARKEAKRLISEAISDCQRKGAELNLEMQEKAMYLATDMIKYIFTEQGRESLHTQLIDELIDEIEKLEKGKINAKGDKAEVVCAYTLGSVQKTKLKNVLSSSLNRDIKLSEKPDPQIIAGLIIKMGGFVIDGSVKNRLRKILSMIKEKERAA